MKLVKKPSSSQLVDHEETSTPKKVILKKSSVQTSFKGPIVKQTNKVEMIIDGEEAEQQIDYQSQIENDQISRQRKENQAKQDAEYQNEI